MQFIGVVLSLGRFPELEPQTFANAQRHLSDFDATQGYSPENVRIWDLTQVEYPIVFRNEGDWDRYVAEYYNDTFYNPPVVTPLWPGIAIIDMTRALPRVPHQDRLEDPLHKRLSGGTFSAFRFGLGTLSHNLAATRDWVSYHIESILRGPCYSLEDLLGQIADLEAIRRQLEMRYGRRFPETIKKYLLAYLQKGVMPPKTIASAILNIIDDYKAGNEINLRSGDYFAIQNYLRSQKAATKGKPGS